MTILNEDQDWSDDNKRKSKNRNLQSFQNKIGLEDLLRYCNLT